jgi:hypothetical protein
MATESVTMSVNWASSSGERPSPHDWTGVNAAGVTHGSSPCAWVAKQTRPNVSKRQENTG